MVEALYSQGYWVFACYALSFVLHWAALSTYWDDVFRYDNFYAHGFGIGLGMLPLGILGLSWQLILARSIVLALLMGIWSDNWDIDWVEEMGRGAFIVATLPILFL